MGWKMWICELLGNETVDDNGNHQQAQICPIHKLKLNMLPAEVKKKVQSHWQQILSMMEKAPNMEI